MRKKYVVLSMVLAFVSVSGFADQKSRKPAEAVDTPSTVVRILSAGHHWIGENCNLGGSMNESSCKNEDAGEQITTTCTGKCVNFGNGTGKQTSTVKCVGVFVSEGGAYKLRGRVNCAD
jgi:hypothetical protein